MTNYTAHLPGNICKRWFIRMVFLSIIVKNMNGKISPIVYERSVCSLVVLTEKTFIWCREVGKGALRWAVA